MIEELKSNLEKERRIIHEIILLAGMSSKLRGSERNFFENSIASLLNAIGTLNDSVPQLLSTVAATEQKLITRAMPKQARVGTENIIVTITPEQKKEFLKDLQIEHEALKKLKKKIKQEPEAETRIKIASFKPNSFTVLAARLFPGLSLSLSARVKNLGSALKKANMPYLLNSYVSMSILGTLAALLAALIAAFIITFLYPGNNIILALLRNLGLSLLLPVFAFIIFYAYPYSQAASIQARINDELPFAVMHMAAVAGSGVEPTRVFSIIAMSKDYPHTSVEIRKLINQINFYGHDLITALKQTARTTSSSRLAELLNGIATTIASGGNLRFYLDKNASDTLLDYKLRRERYVDVSGTYADIYTGLLIAAPLIFMLILSIIGPMGIGSINPETISIAGIIAIVILNMGFLVFLQVSQPES